MNRTQIVIKNAIWELGYYLIVIALGFLAPRYIILIYGSEVNGLTSTITQTLNIILILQAGATTAAVFSLYKPIADNNLQEISKNIYSAQKFFTKISYIFLGLMLIAAIFTALFIKSNIYPQFIFIAFILMGFKSFLDLQFTSKCRIVFTAYQEKYVISIATLIEQIIYYALVFLTLYTRIHFIFMYLWLFISCIVKVAYLEFKFKLKYSKFLPKYNGKDSCQINNRGYAFANEVAHSVVSSSVAIILSFMYGLQETSVYMVYALVGQSLSLVSTSIYSAFAPSFGNMVASENKASIAGVFGIFQFVFVMLNTVMYLCMTALLAPFANIYTSGATDINYMNISLACIMGLSGICSAYRIPYNIAVSTFGFFKETWKQPIICIFVSISVSIGLGILDSSFIVLGPTIFYIINFLYQHFCIKRLVPYLISSHVFIMLGISLFGFIISAYAGIKCAIPMSIISLLLAAVASLIASTIFTLGISRLLLPHEYRCALEYFYSHLPRRFRNA